MRRITKAKEDWVPAVRFTRMALAKLHPWRRNPRKITARALGGLKESIGRFGLVQPIVWNKRSGRVVGGHQRLRALTEEGKRSATVGVVDLDDTEEAALNLALNNRAIRGEWDREGVAALVDRLGLLQEVAFEPLLLDKLLESLEPASVAAVADDAEDAEGGGGGQTGIAVRIVQLFFGPDDYMEFRGLLARAIDRYGVDNASDAVLRVVSDEAEKS